MLSSELCDLKCEAWATTSSRAPKLTDSFHLAIRRVSKRFDDSKMFDLLVFASFAHIVDGSSRKFGLLQRLRPIGEIVLRESASRPTLSATRFVAAITLPRVLQSGDRGF